VSREFNFATANWGNILILGITSNEKHCLYQKTEFWKFREKAWRSGAEKQNPQRLFNKRGGFQATISSNTPTSCGKLDLK
jgi:hypothetical protein